MQIITVKDYITELVTTTLNKKSDGSPKYLPYAKAEVGHTFGMSFNESQTKYTARDIVELCDEPKGALKAIKKLANVYLTRLAVDDLFLFSKETGYKVMWARLNDRKDAEHGRNDWVQGDMTFMKMLEDELDLSLTLTPSTKITNRFRVMEEVENDILTGATLSCPLPKKQTIVSNPLSTVDLGAELEHSQTWFED